jgi:hypothetical protein
MENCLLIMDYSIANAELMERGITNITVTLRLIVQLTFSSQVVNLRRALASS